MQPEHVEAVTRGGVATFLSYTSSGSLLIFGMTAHDMAALTTVIAGFVGILGVIGTFAVTVYYRRKEFNRGR